MSELMGDNGAIEKSISYRKSILFGRQPCEHSPTPQAICPRLHPESALHHPSCNVIASVEAPHRCCEDDWSCA